MFSTGFIYANNLNQVDSARAAYTLFLEKYPQSELAASAKGELENLGRTPEEIIGKVEMAKKPKRTALGTSAGPRICIWATAAN